MGKRGSSATDKKTGAYSHVSQAAAQQNASQLAQVVRNFTVAHRPQNTQKAYDPKNDEYVDFCNHAYSSHGISTRYTVTTEKLFLFLFYHAFREQYKRGGMNHGRAHGFSGSDYDYVQETWATYQSQFDAGTLTEIPDPANPVGWDTINTYKAVVYNIWEEQASEGANSLSWDLIFSRKCRLLCDLVKNRKRRVKRKQNAEKIDHEFAPFTSMGQVGNIELQFWLDGKTPRSMLPALRNRFVFLMCYCGLLRHESLFLGELSDMLHVQYDREKDWDPFFIMVMQIATGKLLIRFYFIRLLY